MLPLSWMPKRTFGRLSQQTISPSGATLVDAAHESSRHGWHGGIDAQTMRRGRQKPSKRTGSVSRGA